MISTSEADQILDASIPDWGTEPIPLADVAGRILREPAVADRPAPPGNRVSMDGIAIRYADWAAGARSFRIQAFQPAGHEPIALAPSDDPACLDIATGSILIGPADSVIPVERLTTADGTATLEKGYTVIEGQNVHLAGADHDTGTPLLPSGLKITSARLAVLASVGMASVNVSKKPRILVASTGDELIPPDQQPESWQLRASNGPAINAALTNSGYDVTLCHWPDDQEDLKKQIVGALNDHDVLIFSGGISAGKKDFLKPVCESAGIEFQFLRVKQRPGKPFAYGTKADKRVFCLPGNPVSALANLHRYVIPFITKAEGQPRCGRRVKIKEAFRFGKDLSFFLPVRLESGEATPVRPNGSGDWATPALADGIVEVPAELNEVAAGTPLRYYPYA